MAETVDFLIIGGGIIGINLALETRRRHPNAHVVVIEKESRLGVHASGRNSGVLHAGFYYSADSLKARFAREGNRLLTQYCLERGLRINRCGKLVVARNEEDLPGLEILSQRAEKNGVELQKITAAEAQAIEPRVKTLQQALYSPTTASVNPEEVLRSLANDAHQAGIQIRLGVGYRARTADGVRVDTGKISAGYVINAAGLYADRIAKDFGFSAQFAILPFKGLYLKSDEPPEALRTQVYPVPNLENPFLGVHYTVTASGEIKVGPTAIPAFWREHYSGFSGFIWSEMVEILSREAKLFWHNDFGFRNLAFQELQKYRKTEMVRQAATLLQPAKNPVHWHWGPPGIRAQLIHVQERRLVMDFHHEGDHQSFHVLNAVSPGFTCSMPFSAYLLDEIGKLA